MQIVRIVVHRNVIFWFPPLK